MKRKYEDEERQLHDILAMLREDYERAAKPFLDRLGVIYSIRQMEEPVVVFRRDAP